MAQGTDPDPQLIAVDLDGTLLAGDGTVPPEGSRLLRTAARDGWRVVLATTRNPDFVGYLCHVLGISDPIICTNGAQVWGSPDGPVWAHHTIPKEIALAIARLADEHGWELSTTVGPMTYLRQRPGQALGQIAPSITVVGANADAIVGDALRILASQPDAIEAIRAICGPGFAKECRAEVFLAPDGTLRSLGVFAPQANKGAALALVLGRLAVDPSRVIAIGDNLNDLPMFLRAQTSIAMGNAPDEVKEQATLVAPTNDDEGVAWALRALGVS